MANLAHRRQVIHLYKELLYLGRNYPQGYPFFRERVHKAFMAHAGLQGDLEIQKAIQKATYVKGEIEALYFLKKYRSLCQSYSS